MKTNKQIEQDGETDPHNEFMRAPQIDKMIQPVEQKVEIKEVIKKNSKNKPKKQSNKYQKGVQDNPQYFRVDYQLTHKLYQIYRRLKITIPHGDSSFEQKNQANNTVNYHKIMQMFKDIDYRLEINQKLQVLRAIKKFCFNQNYINQDEFIKVFKVIVHGIGIKEAVFKNCVQSKYLTVMEKDAHNIQKRAISIRLNKNFGKKIKTQTQEETKHKPQISHLFHQNNTIQTIVNGDQSFIKKMSNNPSIVMAQSKISSARKIQSRKRMLTDVSRYEGVAHRGYLGRLIEKNKLGKLTWENLFNMTQQNLVYNNITIPSFVTQSSNLDDLYF